MEQVRKPDLIWPIFKFSSLTEKVSSEDIDVKHNGTSSQFFLILYPFNERSKEFISIYLDVATLDQIHVFFKFKLEDKDGKSFKSLISDHIFPDQIFPDENGWGFPQLMRRKDILPLKDDTLIVKCWIYMSSSIGNDCIEYIYNDINEQIPEDFNELLRSGSFSDIILETADGKQFPAHKSILESYSPVFKALFIHKQNKVAIEDIDSITLKALLEFMYLNKLDEKQCEIKKLFAASEKYQITMLQSLCETKLCEQFTEENAFEYLCIADDYKIKKLKTIAMKCLTKNIPTIPFKYLEEVKPHLLSEIILFIKRQ